MVFFKKMILFYAIESDVKAIKNKLEYENIEGILQTLPAEYSKNKPATFILWLLVQNHDYLMLQNEEKNKENDYGFQTYRDNFLSKKALIFIKEESQLMESELTYMDSIASLSPFIGLLGTIVGFVLNLKGLKQDVSVYHLSASIGQSLMTTAVSLMVAIPASFFYTIFQAKSSFFRETLMIVAQDVILKLPEHDRMHSHQKEKYTTPLNSMSEYF
jgi:biopolymer transport protein ExbB/TolQ